MSTSQRRGRQGQTVDEFARVRQIPDVIRIRIDPVSAVNPGKIGVVSLYPTAGSDRGMGAGWIERANSSLRHQRAEPIRLQRGLEVPAGVVQLLSELSVRVTPAAQR